LPTLHAHLGGLAPAVDEAAARAAAWVPRIWQRDHTVWSDDPTELADRLGWLDAPDRYTAQVDRLEVFAAGVRADGITDVLLVGMGGSSLYPEVLAGVDLVAPDAPRLHVLDATHPHAVARVRDTLPWDTTLLVASSKSGTTVETRSHLDTFRAVLTDRLGADLAPSRIAVVTDPGSAFAREAEAAGFRDVFTNDPEIGGRFSALSLFGLVPAALLGVDLRAHLATASRVAELARRADAEENTPLRLGAVLAAAAQAGRWQATVLLPASLGGLGAWIEQLVAESTGKHGMGVLPVVDEPPLDPDAYGSHRLVVAVGDAVDEAWWEAVAEAGTPAVQVPAAGAHALPGEVFRWEFATAVCGALLGINPFDQPDVQAAKTAANEALAAGAPDEPTVDVEGLLDRVGDADHVGLLVYGDAASDDLAGLDDVAASLRDRLGVPVTLGIGPRYLHSTGQLHKGGPDVGVYLVAVQDVVHDVGIPGRDTTFGTLVRAQAAGDLAALRAAGRTCGRVTLAGLRAAAG
jgi:transaldolase / glucose-6-phosphate isomerase